MEFIELTPTNSGWKSLRVGAEFVLVASEVNKNPFTINKRKTVDDENTPGRKKTDLFFKAYFPLRGIPLE